MGETTSHEPLNRQQRRAQDRLMMKRLRQLPTARRAQVAETVRSNLAADIVRRSLHPEQPGSLSLALPADNPEGVALLERFDGMAGLRNAMRTIAKDRNEWAGIPMMMSGCRLVVEPTYPKAAELMAFGAEKFDACDSEAKVRNTFWSWHRRTNIVVWEENGKIKWGSAGFSNQLAETLHTLNASDAWGIEQESNAVHTLGGLLKHRQFKQYILTGSFMEVSKRSGVHYLFRRLRPTVAISTARATLRALCCLCLHPIGYYAGSWAGAMCPTDDVIAHLMLMRGDEHMFWRRANQHPVWVPQAGIS